MNSIIGTVHSTLHLTSNSILRRKIALVFNENFLSQKEELVLKLKVTFIVTELKKLFINRTLPFSEKNKRPVKPFGI
jgi:hypothetical protein